MNKNILFPWFVLLPQNSFLFGWKIESFMTWTHWTLILVTWRFWWWNFNAFDNIVRSEHIKAIQTYVIKCDFRKIIIQWNKYSHYFNSKTLETHRTVTLTSQNLIYDTCKSYHFDLNRWKLPCLKLFCQASWLYASSALLSSIHCCKIWLASIP